MTSPDLTRPTISLAPRSSEPVFAQIVSCVRDDVRSGTLAAGTRLPTTRALATELGVAVNTVAKAYRDLEAEGVLEGRGRRGTYVVDQSGTAGEREAVRFAETMKDLGVSQEHALDLVRRAWS